MFAEAVLVVCIVLMWLIGGQRIKSVRRYGIPASGAALVYFRRFNKDKKISKSLMLLAAALSCVVLSMGYGVDSKLMKLFKRDWIVRIVYGIITAIPLAIVTYALHEPIYKILVTVVVLGAGFSIRAGSLGRVYVMGRSYDILIEDIVRSLCWALCLVWIV